MSEHSPDKAAPVLARSEGAVLMLTLNRPQVRNAFDAAAASAMEAAIDRFESDDALRVAVLTGGSEFFCAGVDLRAAARGERPRLGARG